MEQLAPKFVAVGRAANRLKRGGPCFSPFGPLAKVEGSHSVIRYKGG